MKLQHRINPLHKDVSKADIRAKRELIEGSPVSIRLSALDPFYGLDLKFHTDDLSLRRMSSQLRNMKRSGNKEIVWGLAGGETVILTQATLREAMALIQEAFDNRVDALYHREKYLLSQYVVTQADIEDDQWSRE